MKNGPRATMTVPAFRPDLTREIDLIEELARINGFDKIPSRFPVITASAPERSSYDLVRKIREQLAAGGFTEAVNISLVGSVKQKKYYPDRQPVNIANPLSSEKDTMRLSLLPGLLDNLVYATTWKEKSVRMFEVGTVFSSGDGGPVEGIVEKTNAAALAFGPRPRWVEDNKRGESDFFDVLGLLQHLCDCVWHCEPEIARASDTIPVFLAPASACRISLQGEACGWIGELHPGFYQWLDIPKTKAEKGKVGLFEMSLPPIKPVEKKFKPIPAYPSAERDIAMIFNDNVQVEDVLQAVRKEAGDILESVSLFDIYRGKGTQWSDNKSMAFSLIYRSVKKTLKTEEIDEIHSKVIHTLEKRLGGKLR